MTPTTTRQLITPDQATEWLRPAHNRENRPLRQDHVVFLAREISEGRWELTHQGIAFSTTGRLLDGQHRLAAVVRAGQAVPMMVTINLADEAFRAIDCGMKRANYDRIHLVDDQRQNRIICMAVRSYLVETRRDNQISVGDIEDEFLTKDKAWMWAGAEFSGLNNRLLKAGVAAAMGIYNYINADRSAAFMAGYRDGSGLPPGSPILKLRNDALTGTHRDVSYWRSQALMRAHLHDKTVERVYEASEDMMGNENTSRVIKARSATRVKAAATRRGKG